MSVTIGSISAALLGEQAAPSAEVVLLLAALHYIGAA